MVPKFPQLDTEKAIKVSMTAFVSALLVSGERKRRLLTSIFFHTGFAFNYRVRALCVPRAIILLTCYSEASLHSV